MLLLPEAHFAVPHFTIWVTLVTSVSGVLEQCFWAPGYASACGSVGTPVLPLSRTDRERERERERERRSVAPRCQVILQGARQPSQHRNAFGHCISGPSAQLGAAKQSTMQRLLRRFDGRSTAYQRSLRSQRRNPLAAVALTYLFM